MHGLDGILVQAFGLKVNLELTHWHEWALVQIQGFRAGSLLNSGVGMDSVDSGLNLMK